MESAASGMIAGINAARVALEQDPVVPPRETIIGGLLDYIATCPVKDFQPMNSNFGLLPPVEGKYPKKVRSEKKIEHAREAMNEFAGKLLPGDSEITSVRADLQSGP